MTFTGAAGLPGQQRGEVLDADASLPPKPPPTPGTITRTREDGSCRISESVVWISKGSCVFDHTVTWPALSHWATAARGSV